MTAAAKSVFYFGLYLYVVGLTLLIAPNFLLATFQIAFTSEVWIRVVGVLTLAIGFYYHQAGSRNIVAFLPLTLVVRVLVFLAFVVFVVLKYVSPSLIIIGSVDLLGAAWTLWALKKK